MEAQFAALEKEATARLRHEGVSDENAVLQREISMRYAGQWRSLSVRIGSGRGALEAAIETFHQEHEREFAFRQDDQPVEIYQLLLSAIGKTPKPAFVPATELEPIRAHRLRCARSTSAKTGWVTTPVYDRDRLPAGATFDGPAIVDQLDSTTVVPPRTTAEIDGWGNIRIHLHDLPSTKES